MIVLRLQNSGFGPLLFFKFLCRNSSTAAVANPTARFLVDYLINSLGFSNDEALSATKNLHLSKSFRNNPDLVLKFLENLGLNKPQIKTIVSKDPRLLFCDVDKTLRPKIEVLKNLGLHGSDIIGVLMKHNMCLLRRGLADILVPIGYLRELLGSDEKVVMAVKKCAPLLNVSTPKMLAPNVQLLKRAGFSDEKVFNFILGYKRVMRKPESLEEIFYRVENEFGISPDSKMFYYGVWTASSLRQSTIDSKFGILRSFGWSDSNIYCLVRHLPCALCKSEAKLREIIKFFMDELGYTPEYIASRSAFFTLSFHRRVKPRSEVYKILNDKKLNKKKANLYTVLRLPESKFLKDYLLPHKDELPDVYDSYIRSVGR